MFFFKDSKSKRYIFKGGGDEVGVKVGWGRGQMDGQINRPKPIFPFNFFEVGGVTMH